MNVKVAGLLLGLALVLSTIGAQCVNSPIVVTINLGAITGCYPVIPADGTWGATTSPIMIRDLIDDNFENGLLRFRLYDIRLRLTNNFPDGPLAGTIWFAFDTAALDTAALDTLFTFNGQSSDFENDGVSLLDPGNIIDLQEVNLNRFIGALNNISTLPQTVILKSSGSGPIALVLAQFCVDIYVQADAEIN